jgi:hypothetical protein
MAAWAVPAGAATAPSNSNPTPAQIAKAIKQAKASKSLWATVNICGWVHHRDTLGIRGQMPTLGFPAWLSMNIALNYWSPQEKKFVSDKTSRFVRLGRLSHNLQQDGASFNFYPHAGLFDAHVTFIWRREGKLLGQKTLLTTAGHPADLGSPANYSAARCKL